MIRSSLFTLSLFLAAPVVAQTFVLDPPAPEFIAADAGDLYNTTTLVVLAGDAETADRLIAATPAYELLSRENLTGIGEEMLVFRLPEGVTGKEAIGEMETLEPGVTAGVNHAYRAPPPAELPEGREYANGLIGWPQQGCAAQVPIGIIDTDIAPDEAGLARAKITRKQFVGEGGDNGHGTAIAELIGGPGRLTGANIYHASVVGPVDGKSPAAGVDTLVRAIDWLRSNDVRLVNVSLAGPYNKILDRALQAAAARGMVIVAAAGNTGREGPPRYPAAFKQTIAVTAVDAALEPYEKAPEGGHIDIAAPGVDVFVPQGGGKYLSGTSIAAPFVTSIIAADPVASGLGDAAELRDWLSDGARDLGVSGPDPVFGTGLAQPGSACRKG